MSMAEDHTGDKDEIVTFNPPNWTAGDKSPPPGQADPNKSDDVCKHFNGLDLVDDTRIQASYIWIGGKFELRSKTRTLPKAVSTISDIPEWNFDGSSTEQAPGEDSEVYLRPVSFVDCPFRRRPNILVLCECVKPDGEPIPTNTRRSAAEFFEKAQDEHCWFGLEQEYTLFSDDGRTPLGWPKNGFPAPQGPYYCGVGAHNAFGREVVEAHYKACLYAGIGISGCNAEVMAGQWEYQVGPVEGIACGDQMMISRFLLIRIAEMFGVVVSFDPKPIPGDWNGAGCHANFSTEKMRNKGGFDEAKRIIKNLEKSHVEMMKVYGEGNELRMTGKHETAAYDKFSWGVADRGASIRVPRQMEKDGKGYIEDRRPASNCDPYVVSSTLAKVGLGM
eukprot:133942_1